MNLFRSSGIFILGITFTLAANENATEIWTLKPDVLSEESFTVGAFGPYGTLQIPKDVIEIVKDAEKLADASRSFWHAFVASLSVIIVSELGDKTWFIAAILAMRHSRVNVFLGTMMALFLMTVLSSCIGWGTQIIPRIYIHYISNCLLCIFGVKMLYDAQQMEGQSEKGEYEEAKEEVLKKDNDVLPRTTIASDKVSNCLQIFVKSFSLAFVAEWGDRSQFTTIILAARENVLGICMGGTLGHAICTGIAVIGGRLVAEKISVKTVTLIGGFVFLCFAIIGFLIGSDA